MGETYLSLAKRNTIFNHLIRENKKPLTITKKSQVKCLLL
jgi:hypothetical protein